MQKRSYCSVESRTMRFIIWTFLALSPSVNAFAVSTSESDFQKDDWHYAEWDNVTIISNSKRSKTDEIARTVAQFLQHMDAVLPFPRREDSWPLEIFVCKDSRTFRYLAPDEPKYQNDVSGIFTNGLGYDAIIIHADTGMSSLRSIVFHELVHRELRPLEGIPLWLDEGLAEVYSNFRLSGKWIHYGLSDSRHRHYLQRKKQTPFERLFEVTHSSPDYHVRELSISFYATSWAFTHFALFGKEGIYKDRFLNFIEIARDEFITEAIFKEHFEMGYEEMSDQLRRYVSSFRFPKSRSKLQSETNLPSFEWETLESPHIELLLAGATTLSRRHERSAQLLGENPQSLNTLQALWYRQKTTLNYYLGNHLDAQELAETAYEYGDRSPTTLLLYAEKLLNTAPGWRVYYDEVLSLKEINRAFRCINQVLEIAPRHPLACKLYALGWMRTTNKPSREQYRKLMNNARLHIDDPEICFLTADLMSINKEWRMAKSILEHFIETSSSAEDQQAAVERLRNMP